VQHGDGSLLAILTLSVSSAAQPRTATNNSALIAHANIIFFISISSDA
jgi:hypothetical protein